MKPSPLRTKKPGTPIVKPVSTKPSDAPFQMKATRQAGSMGLGGIPAIPQLPALVAKKTGVGKISKARPKTGMK